MLSPCSAAGSPLPGWEGAHGTTRLPSQQLLPLSPGLWSPQLTSPAAPPASCCSADTAGTGPLWSHTPLAVLSGDVNLTTFRKHSPRAPAPREPLCRQSPCLCFDTEHTLTRTGFSGAFPGTRVLNHLLLAGSPRGPGPWLVSVGCRVAPAARRSPGLLVQQRLGQIPP